MHLLGLFDSFGDAWSKSKCINMMYFHLDWWVPHAFFTHFLGLFVGSGLGNPSLERELVRRIICGFTIWLWPTVRHGKSPFLRTVIHLFLWAIYTMAMLNNQRVVYFDEVRFNLLLRDPPIMNILLVSRKKLDFEPINSHKSPCWGLSNATARAPGGRRWQSTQK